MNVGFVIPGRGADDEPPSRALVDGVDDLAEELRRQGHEVALEELAPSWWMLPPSAFVERALSLIDRFEGCHVVVDHSGAWAPLVRRSGWREPVLVAGMAASPTVPPGQRATLEEAALPAVDPGRYEVGRGAGGYVIGELRPDERRALVDHAVVDLPGDAGRPERAALLADAVAFLAPQGTAGRWSAVEALACGTPVIARAGTPAAEVITDGVTGVLVDDGSSLGEAMFAASALDRWACRHAACERFSVERRARDLASAGAVLSGEMTLSEGPATVAETTIAARTATSDRSDVTLEGDTGRLVAAAAPRSKSVRQRCPAPVGVGYRILATASR
jgi:glycosyltransferase involved in cell wall biosynthesis